MIIEKLLDFIILPIEFIISKINIPAIDLDLYSKIDEYIALILDNARLIKLFIRLETVVPLLAMLIAVQGIYYGYLLIMWVIRKLPIATE